MQSRAIPVQIISGFLGAGKTTLIQQLLSCLPTNTKAAVVINEFARLGLDGDQLAPFSSTHAIRQIAGGCICCTSAPLLRTAIIRLIREESPHLILIEPTGLGTPSDIQKILTSPGLVDHLRVQPTICLVATSALNDQRYLSHEVFQAQLVTASTVILTQGDANTAAVEQLHTLCSQQPKYLFAPTIEAFKSIATDINTELQTFHQAAQSPAQPLPEVPPLQLRPSNNLTPDDWYIEQSGTGIAASFFSQQLYFTSRAEALAKTLSEHLRSAPYLLRAKGTLSFKHNHYLDWQYANQRLDWHTIEDNHPTQIVIITNTNAERAVLQDFCQQLITRLASFAE